MEGNWYEIILLSFNDIQISLGNVVTLAIGLTILIYGFIFLNKRFTPKFLDQQDINPEQSKKFRKLVWHIFILTVLLFILFSLPINFTLFTTGSLNISIGLIFRALFFIQLARLLDWFVSNIFINKYYTKRDETTKKEKANDVLSESSASKTAQHIVYLVVGLFILNYFKINDLIYTTNFTEVPFEFRLSNILRALLAILIARLLIWAFTQLLLYGLYKQKKIDRGAQYALNQLLSYVVYTIAFIIALQHLGIDMTLIWGGAAALLVGIGLGLQQTFNDFFSGIIILFERTVKIGDILEIEGKIGTVHKIGLRASTLLSVSNIATVVPNSEIVNQKVTNWSHLDDKSRFDINVGVAYGSDTSLVKKLLLQSAKKNPYVIDYPAPFVRFNNFGDSALDFTLYLFSRNFIVIEDIKSDIRFEIDRLFRENDISIPFPQRDVWIKKES